MKSLGSDAFSRLPQSVERLAEMYGKSPDTIYAWRRGSRTPTKADRIRIAEDHPHIAPSLWDQPLAEAPRNPVRDTSAIGDLVTPGEADSSAAISEADRLLGEIRRLRVELESVEGDVHKRATTLAMLSKLTVDLGRLTGVGLVVTDRQILNSPYGVMIADRILEALKPWPDAARAVGAALLAMRAQP